MNHNSLFALLLTALAILGCAGREKAEKTFQPILDAREPFPPLFRCTTDVVPVDKHPRTYAGFYEAEFEMSSFKVSHIPCEVWLSGDICPIFGEGNCTKGAEVKAYISVEGVLTPPGHYGHFGMWERELVVTRVLGVQRIRHEEQD